MVLIRSYLSAIIYLILRNSIMNPHFVFNYDNSDLASYTLKDVVKLKRNYPDGTKTSIKLHKEHYFYFSLFPFYNYNN